MDQRVTESAPLLTTTVLHGRLEGLVGEIHIAQTFRNAEPVNIEAVFTFPVPPEAVLLGVEVTIDGRVLRGQVLAAAQAEEDYEEAIVSGDGAILLQSAGPGRYTINVGNLLPGQLAELDYRYALIGVWDEDLWRLLLPTTIAPRYGNPHQAGLAPHQVPQVSLLAEHRFTLDLVLGSSLRQARVDSPSHQLLVIPEEAGQRVRLAQGSGPLDRDLILLIRAEATARFGQAFVAPDWQPDEGPVSAGGVALISVQPQFSVAAPASGHDYVLVADASGSMAGDSIAQTREALAAILDRLQPADRFNLIIFGSAPESLFPSLAPAESSYLASARQAVRRLQADRGGTEIGNAMRLAHEERQERPLDILLITDGETWNTAAMIDSARQSGDRVFTIGVGAAVAADLVQGLAGATGGACTLVHPNEAMSDKILRQFEGIRAPRASVKLNWPAEPQWQWPDQPDTIFAGDTLHWLAGFSSLPAGQVTLTFTLADGSTQSQTLDLLPWPEVAQADTLPRLAAARRLKDLDPATATALAVRYQLVSPHTHFMLRDPRNAAQQADTLPLLRQVPHQLAAGWGGMGAVASVPMGRDSFTFGVVASAVSDSAASSLEFLRFQRRPGVAKAESRPSRFRGLFQAWRGKSPKIQSGAAHVPAMPQPPAPAPFAAWLESQVQRLADPQEPLPTLAEVLGAGLPDLLVEEIKALMGQGEAESPVVAAVLYALVMQTSPGRAYPRATLRRLRFLLKHGLSKDRVERLVVLANTCLPLRHES